MLASISGLSVATEDEDECLSTGSSLPPSRQLTKVSFCLKSQTARKEKNYTGINREEIKKKKIKRILKWNISGSVLTRRLQNVWQVYIKETAQSARQTNRKLSREAAHTGHRKVQ